MSLFKRASRSNVKIKLNLAGPSGSGKTMSALRLAKGIVGDMSKVAVIDTEQGSSELYANKDLKGFFVARMNAPFKPQKYCMAIDHALAEKFDLVIIDSVSHEWDGEGGCLDIQASLGGRFQDWAKVTPMHREFINKIVQSPVHIITTARQKTEYEVSKDGGKTTVSKVGTKEVQREGYEFEMSVSLNIQQDHKAVSSKDRTGLFVDQVPFLITEETGRRLLDWSQTEEKETGPVHEVEGNAR